MEQNHSENTKRIAKNTLMLYGRMLFSMVVSLYTSRVVLNTLGVVDYGVYNVVGGFVTMFSLVSTALSSSVSRFLTYELGCGDIVRLKKAFSTSLLIQIALSVLVLIIAETIGLWFLNNKMTIPVDRLNAAQWVFQASVLSFIVGLLSVPYNASIVSHERMNAFAYIGILQVLLKLLIVLFIAYSGFHFDKLIVYSLLLVLVGILMQTIYWVYCRKNFEECRFEIDFDKQCWKEMSSFAGWNFIGCTAGLFKDQGVNILLNLFFGPVLNAARGISMTVSNTVGGFANNFMVALNPQITKSYASHDEEYCHSLVERGARFSFFILFTITVPIFLETEYILTLWLKQYPEATVNFVRLVLLLSLTEILSNTLITLQLATGEIKAYQLVVGGVLLLNLPISYLCLHLGFAPESTLIVAILLSLVCMLIRLSFLSKIAKLSISSYLKNVCTKVLVVAVVASILPVIFHGFMPVGWCRLLVVLLLSLISSVLTIYFLGCSLSERQFIASKLSVLKSKLFNGRY